MYPFEQCGVDDKLGGSLEREGSIGEESVRGVLWREWGPGWAGGSLSVPGSAAVTGAGCGVQSGSAVGPWGPFESPQPGWRGQCPGIYLPRPQEAVAKAAGCCVCLFTRSACFSWAQTLRQALGMRELMKQMDSLVLWELAVW